MCWGEASTGVRRLSAIIGVTESRCLVGYRLGMIAPKLRISDALLESRLAAYLPKHALSFVYSCRSLFR